jgi:hypothetical protein
MDIEIDISAEEDSEVTVYVHPVRFEDAYLVQVAGLTLTLTHAQLETLHRVVAPWFDPRYERQPDHKRKVAP